MVTLKGGRSDRKDGVVMIQSQNYFSVVTSLDKRAFIKNFSFHPPGDPPKRNWDFAIRNHPYHTLFLNEFDFTTSSWHSCHALQKMSPRPSCAARKAGRVCWWMCCSGHAMNNIPTDWSPDESYNDPFPPHYIPPIT